MSHSIKRVVVTGAGGQIAYSLIFRIANGELLGPNQRIALYLLDVPDGVAALSGLVMELEDCTFPLLHEIHVGSDPNKIFEGAEFDPRRSKKPARTEFPLRWRERP